MVEALNLRERIQSPGEEVANSVSHGVGLLAVMTAFPVLVIAAVQRGGVAGIVGASIFASTMVLLYLTSMLYHALPTNSRAKQVFQVVDHVAIFLLIAGTYTPFTLGVLYGTWGWTLFGFVWGLALVGIVLKVIGGARYTTLSTYLYLAIGWLPIIAIKPMWLHVPVWGLLWLLAGGIAYTVGVIFFMMDERLHYSHFVWHLFVIAGTACHFVAVLWYAA